MGLRWERSEAMDGTVNNVVCFAWYFLIVKGLLARQKSGFVDYLQEGLRGIKHDVGRRKRKVGDTATHAGAWW